MRLAAMLVAAACLAAPSPSVGDELPRSTPEAEGMRSAELIDLTKWIRDHPAPIFSLLVSRHGRLVYELYTGGVDPDAAHYLMSVTKSVLSALIGIAIDRRRIRGPDETVASLLPRDEFAGDADLARFRSLTLKQVMGMAALDAPDPPRRRDAEAMARWRRFWTAPDRLRVALAQPRLAEAFQYNDATPALAAGALQYATGRSALEFAEEALFRPLGFRNYEWMHQDASGLDNGGYGLRLRPIDMQKLGLLYLRGGEWNGARVISKEWIARSFTPWNRSRPDEREPDYGWFWWTYRFGPGWTAHVAVGWKGQRIAVLPEQDLVVTMTGCIEDGSDDALFARVIERVLRPSVERAREPAPGDARALAALLDEVRRGAPRLDDFIEYRMVPSTAPKAGHRPFALPRR